MCRIGLSAVVDDLVTRDGLGRKPSLLILRQLAYPDRGWPAWNHLRRQISDQMMTLTASGTRRMGRSICELLL
jgi:hypothetical protein